jgi:conjugative transfer signal peptidase TraF
MNFREKVVQSFKKSTGFEKKFLLFSLLLLGVAIFLFSTSRLIVNHSRSLPYHVLLLMKGGTFKRGDLIAIEKEVAFLDHKNFLKKVAGIPGDKVEVKEDGVFIKGEQVAKVFIEKTSKGIALTRVKTQVLSKNTYFVVGVHERSLDSRYQEFGLVKKENIFGKAYPIY